MSLTAEHRQRRVFKLEVPHIGTSGDQPGGITIDQASLAMAGNLHDHLGQLIRPCAHEWRHAALDEVGGTRTLVRRARRDSGIARATKTIVHLVELSRHAIFSA